MEGCLQKGMFVIMLDQISHLIQIIKNAAKSVQVLHGTLQKFTKGGKARHKRYVALYSDGWVRWGDDEDSSSKYKG